jgi:redox-regulated HSP33 family molecular chaperone
LLDQFLASAENEWASGKGWKAPFVYDDTQIPRIAGQLMEAFGWPEDRREYVEDDLRKMSRVDQAKRLYCRHLEAIQNLAHTQSPRTIYTRPTQYTCKCQRLGHRTVIEQEDIDVVIKAMQRTYCDECTHREPGSGD